MDVARAEQGEPALRARRQAAPLPGGGGGGGGGAEAWVVPAFAAAWISHSSTDAVLQHT